MQGGFTETALLVDMASEHRAKLSSTVVDMINRRLQIIRIICSEARAIVLTHANHDGPDDANWQASRESAVNWGHPMAGPPNESPAGMGLQGNELDVAIHFGWTCSEVERDTD